ncbi:MAG: Na/Pi cotransporter family protein [Oscillospiraceae bacterium]|nr:Na/Pi cotransporter family protein [Oscillospiraceae bacterium]
MTIFDVLTMIGGLCLFLFGMNVMGDGLERRAGSSLKALLGKLTDSRIKGFLTGLGVTAVIQSSSATTVMVVGFVNSRLMTLKQSIGVIMGANIGTTVTAWILSLSGISSDNLFMQLLKPTSFTPVLALVGTVFLMFSKSTKQKDVGTILLGFSTLMFGMDTMSGAVSGLADIPAFQELFLMFENPVLGVLVGAVLTGIIQSSSASVGILQALSATGAVSYAAAIPIIMGQNIGTCVTALLSSFGANKNAKRAAVIHLAFNVIGTVVWLGVFSLVSAFVQPAILHASASYLGIAVCHSLFNTLCTVLLLPQSGLLEKIAYLLVPEGRETAKTVELDERLLATPSIALGQCHNLVLKMAEKTVTAVQMSLDALLRGTVADAEKIRSLEKDVDHYEDALGTFLTKLARAQISDDDSSEVSKLLKIIGDLERISDHSVNVLESAEEMKEKKIIFSEHAQKEMEVLCNALTEILGLTMDSLRRNDWEAAASVEPLEQVIDHIKSVLRNRHIARLKRGECSVEAGFIWADLLTDMERTSDHCSNIAVSIMDAHKHNMNAHQSLRKLKEGNTAFFEKLDDYSRKYQLPQA